MFFLSLLFLSLSHVATSDIPPQIALPRHFNEAAPSILHPSSDPNFFGNRSIYNIIWSCLATIVACTWLAVHPNLPAPKDGELRIFLRRLAVMGYLLLVPEMVIMWASRQYLAVLEISQRHSDRGWAKPHAFFLAMGGFMLYENDRPLRTLLYPEFEELLEQQKIDWPLITEEEIGDKSKGDYLSKAVVVLQTSWFIAQCIVRARYRLAITELEVVTLAFAAISLVIYALWWHKPLDIKVAVPVHLKGGQTLPFHGAEPKAPPRALTLPATHIQHSDEALRRVKSFSSGVPASQASSSRPPKVQLDNSTTELNRFNDFHPVNDGPQPTSSVPFRESLHITTSPEPQMKKTGLDGSAPSNLTRFRNYLLKQQKKHGVWRGTAYVLFVRPFVPFFSAFDDMISCSTLDGKRFRVPTFYSPSVENDGLCYLLGLLVALIFGGIHCIAWNFHFPSVQEKWIWRVAAILVCGSPLLIVIFSAFIDGGDKGYSSRWREFLDKLDSGFLAVLACLYMLARLSLLVLPLMGLRSLPPSAYVDLNWTTFIPHI